ncbi:putative transmembrane protein [Toxoplasma gondii GT1]|uniref:Putative transmembrane protein n=2 Tax=Toxoplasma gondii TaxID=5811 RepID=S7W3N0_TOXGG|nr:putative transmembrane protein [Toxoplasma gondii GT1]
MTVVVTENLQISSSPSSDIILSHGIVMSWDSFRASTTVSSRLKGYLESLKAVAAAAKNNRTVAAMFLHHKPTALAVPVITVALQGAYLCLAVYTAACLMTAVDIFPDSVNAVIGGLKPSRSLSHHASLSLQPLLSAATMSRHSDLSDALSPAAENLPERPPVRLSSPPSSSFTDTATPFLRERDPSSLLQGNQVRLNIRNARRTPDARTETNAVQGRFPQNGLPANSDSTLPLSKKRVNSSFPSPSRRSPFPLSVPYSSSPRSPPSGAPRSVSSPSTSFASPASSSPSSSLASPPVSPSSSFQVAASPPPPSSDSSPPFSSPSTLSSVARSLLSPYSASFPYSSPTVDREEGAPQALELPQASGSFASEERRVFARPPSRATERLSPWGQTPKHNEKDPKSLSRPLHSSADMPLPSAARPHPPFYRHTREDSRTPQSADFANLYGDPRRLRGSHWSFSPALLKRENEEETSEIFAELAAMGDRRDEAYPLHAPVEEKGEEYKQTADAWAHMNVTESLWDPKRPSILEVTSFYYSSPEAVVDAQGVILEETKRVQMSGTITNLLWFVFRKARFLCSAFSLKSETMLHTRSKANTSFPHVLCGRKAEEMRCFLKARRSPEVPVAACAVGTPESMQ